jgi:hypothetical protein
MTAPGIPSVQVFLGEETAGIDGAVTWVDITAYVRLESGITTSRGQSFGGGAQPGTASLTLENTDGRFTVGNVSSPYYPYVHLQSLVELLRDGRPWFIGRIQSGPMAWPTGGDSIATVTWSLADKLARYERMMLGSFPVEEIMVTAPAAYYPMTEAAGSVQSDDKTKSWSALKLLTPGDGAIVYAGATGPAGDSASSPQFTPGTIPASLYPGAGPFNNGGFSNGWTLGFAFATTAGGLVARFVMNGNATGMTWTGTPPRPNRSLTIEASVETYVGLPGVMIRCSSDSGSLYSQFHYPVAVMDGATHAVAVTYGALYIDGNLINPTTVVAGQIKSFNTDSASLQIGSASPGVTGALTPFTGTISHVAVWPRILSNIEANTISLALRGWSSTAQVFIHKVLGWRGQHVNFVIGLSTTLISSKSIGNASLATILGNLNASEVGTLYVDGQDRLTWSNRRTALSPAISIAATDIDPGIVYNYDLTRVQTSVTASRTVGGSVTVQSADYNTIGEIAGSVASMSTDPDDALMHASWTANTGPRDPYIGSLAIDVATAQFAYPSVQLAGILTQVTLTGMLSQTPPNSTVLEVIGEQETVSATSWNVTWMTLPAGSGSARDLLILDDATYGVLNSTHKLAY